MERLNLTQPRNEDEFQKMMEAVDEYLRNEAVPRHARQIQGWKLISWSLGLGSRMGSGQDRKPREGCYTGDDLTIRILQWIEKQYGDSLLIDFGPGRVFLLIRGDPWVVRMPKIWGTAILFASSTELSSRPEEYLRKREVPRLNVLEQIEAMPAALRASLTAQEQKEILDHFVVAYKSMLAVEVAKEEQLIAEARGDIDAAVHHAIGQDARFGYSKWSSLQASEKALKSYLASKGRPFPRIHDLRELAREAVSEGLSRIDATRLNSIQCTPGIRYGEEPCDLQGAWAAHWSSLRVCGRVARSLVRGARLPTLIIERGRGPSGK